MIVFDPSRIKLAREYRQLTQAQLASQVGASSQQLKGWEDGKSCPSAANLAKLMNALEAPATFFYVHGGVCGAYVAEGDDDGDGIVNS